MKNDKTHAVLPMTGGEIKIPRPRLACLLRRWRNDPDTPRASRNFPTVADLAAMTLTGKGGLA
ncbi:MAG: hypothetical protein EOP88_13345 [Verrucomicrobiaceae bacterium]|nr:MAG: hypothetical protein EOP88_13345 [Verrucomicrobiaceae bacterium]